MSAIGTLVVVAVIVAGVFLGGKQIFDLYTDATKWRNLNNKESK